ncbi:MAG: mechanosensitive ion channel family protein [Clostridia bacterium]|nr:mechanosensitive ion channel family protein [Clostridia bacterium]
MEKKKGLIVKIIAIAICVAVLVLTGVFYEQIFGVGSVFNYDYARNEIVNKILWFIPAIISTVCAVIIGYLIYLLVNLIISVIFERVSNKIKTVLTLLKSLLKWIIIIGVIIRILQAFGVDTATLIAGLGIIALIIGLGAQQIVADVIAGFFIVFEAEFKVGDIITIDGWRGTVTEIGIRVTKVIDASGNVKIINNSDIKSVVNLSSELSVAYLTISIDYDEDLHKVELVLRDNLERISKSIPAIVEGIYYKGVTELGESSVDLMFVATCKETDIFQVKRDINREIFLLFNEYGITIPFNQITLSQREVNPTPYEKKEVKQTKTAKEAKGFLDEQTAKSKAYDEENK